MFGIAPLAIAVATATVNPTFVKSYGYHTRAFHQAVADSYKPSGRNPKLFFDLMDKRSNALHKAKVREWILKERKELAKAKRKGKLLSEEIQVSKEAFDFVKSSIPKFSLDRGYEFCSVTDTGERQCLLQSFLIAAILQDEGLKAGCAMVWENEHGQRSNLGHVTALIRLEDGHDLMVDASHSEPTIAHQGIFLYDKGAKTYAFVHPQFAPGSHEAIAYSRPDGKAVLMKNALGLDLAFLRSQFDFYRGERVPNGFLDPKASPEALKKSAAFFERGLRESSANPLETYLLGTVYRRLGREQDARRMCQAALKLYEKYGWVPDTVKRAAAR